MQDAPQHFSRFQDCYYIVTVLLSIPCGCSGQGRFLAYTSWRYWALPHAYRFPLLRWWLLLSQHSLIKLIFILLKTIQCSKPDGDSTASCIHLFDTLFPNTWVSHSWTCDRIPYHQSVGGCLSPTGYSIQHNSKVHYRKSRLYEAKLCLRCGSFWNLTTLYFCKCFQIFHS